MTTPAMSTRVAEHLAAMQTHAPTMAAIDPATLTGLDETTPTTPAPATPALTGTRAEQMADALARMQQR